jgi:hypothetical protein
MKVARSSGVPAGQTTRLLPAGVHQPLSPTSMSAPRARAAEAGATVAAVVAASAATISSGYAAYGMISHSVLLVGFNIVEVASVEA